MSKVRLISVKKGKNENWLTFKCFFPRMDNSRQFTIDFCGTEANHNMDMTDDETKQLKDFMAEDFGYAPFDAERAKEVLKDHDGYDII